jgi:tellurite resistance protein TehA-like permease
VARLHERRFQAVRKLPPGSFAFVMATGIVSTGVFYFGPSWLSRALLVIAATGLVILGVALIMRLVRHFPLVLADGKAAERAFGFFTITAGLDVLGVRLYLAGHPVATAVLGGIAAPIWLLLTYAVPAGLLLTGATDSVLGGINGTWLLWVVATQSLSIAASVMTLSWPSRANVFAPFAVGLWSVGIVLYLVLVSLILLRWLTVPVTPETLGPPYWILMGATAITVLAGARIVAIPAAVEVRAAAAPAGEDLSLVLWLTWWIPLLVVPGLWRHLRQHWPLVSETGLWSVVFPLGMYSVATLAFGKAAHLSFMNPIADVMVWVAVAAWAVFVALVRRAMAAPAPARTGTAGPVRGLDGAHQLAGEASPVGTGDS